MSSHDLHLRYSFGMISVNHSTLAQGWYQWYQILTKPAKYPILNTNERYLFGIVDTFPHLANAHGVGEMGDVGKETRWQQYP
jgi:hypothetical protein